MVKLFSSKSIDCQLELAQKHLIIRYDDNMKFLVITDLAIYI